MTLTTTASRAGRWKLRLASTVLALLLASAISAALSLPVRAQAQADPAQTGLTQTGLMRPLFPQRTIFWFNNYDPGRTVWNEAQVYHSPDTTVRTATSASPRFSGLARQTDHWAAGGDGGWNSLAGD